MVCATDAATRRSFQRQYGAEPQFVSAQDALRARAQGATWETPRCMTQAEHARLLRLMNQRASL